ncbi:ribonuclease H-like domain-containing protein [Tanacetum coccineum]
MHTIMWRNKSKIETFSLDELFNDLKAYESEVNETSNSTTNSHNVAFLSSSSSNSATGAVNTTQGVNIVSTQGATDSSTTIENLVMLDGLEVEYCYVDYEGKKIPEEYWKESGHGQQRKNFRLTILHMWGQVDKSLVQDGEGMDQSKKARPSVMKVHLRALNKVYPSLDDFVEVNESVSESIVEEPTGETNEPKNTRKENRALIIKDWVSDSDEENVPKVKTVEMFNKPSFAKINFVKSTKQVKPPRKQQLDKNSKSTPSPRGNKFGPISLNTARPKAVISVVKGNKGNAGNPQQDLKDKGMIDSRCSRHMTGNRSYLIDYKEIDGGFVAFGVPRKENIYSVDLKNVVPQGGLTCLFAKATPDESNLWHRRLGHVNFKTMNKLVEAVNTACYVQNKVLVNKPHNKTPYELFLGRKPALSFMRPFGCPVTILNTIDHLGSGPNWLFDIDALIKSMNYKPVAAGNQSNGNAWTKACDDAGKARVEIVHGKDYILIPLWTQDPSFSSSTKDSPDAGFKPSREEEKKDAKDLGNEDGNPSKEGERVDQERDAIASVNNTNNINTVSLTVNAAGIKDNFVYENIVYGCDDDTNMPDLEEIGRFSMIQGLT